MKLWEIIEEFRRNDKEEMPFKMRDERELENHKMGMKYDKSDIKEAYKCGYEDGYRKAMKEAKEYYDERRY